MRLPRLPRILISATAALACLGAATSDAQTKKMKYPAGDRLECETTAFYDLTEKGDLRPGVMAKLGDPVPPEIGRFTVDRSTGLILSKAVSNVGDNITVLDRGSNDQSFKVVYSSSSGNVFASFLLIKLFIDEPKKPFILTETMQVRTGLCW